MQNVLPSLALSPEEETEEEVTIQEKEKMINISYELAAEASKRSKLVAGTSLKRKGRSWWWGLIHRLHVIVILHSVVSSLISLTSAIISCVVWPFNHYPLMYFFILCVCLVCVQHVALSPCSEKPVALFPTPSTVS